MSSAWITLLQAQQKFTKMVHGDAGEKRAISARHVTGEIPPPLEKCNIPPPQKLHEQHLQRQQQNIARGLEEKESGWRAAKEEEKPTARALGALTAVKGLAEKTLTEAKVYTENSIREASFNRDLNLFLEDFGDLIRNGPTALLSCHEGYVMSEGEPHLVDIFVTSTHLCVAGRAIRHAIPLRDIHAIYPSIDLATTSITPFFLHCPAPDVRPTAVQVYTTQGEVFQFLRLAHSVRHAAASSSAQQWEACLVFYAALDDAWRSLLQTAAPPATCEVSESL